jgi:hypothetical protein
MMLNSLFRYTASGLILMACVTASSANATNQPYDLSNKTPTALSTPSATEGGSCPGNGASAYTSNGLALTCVNSKWVRASAWNASQVTAGSSCSGSTGVGSFARGTDGKLYVCR